jgi:hypothetical protein
MSPERTDERTERTGRTGVPQDDNILNKQEDDHLTLHLLSRTSTTTEDKIDGWIAAKMKLLKKRRCSRRNFVENSVNGIAAVKRRKTPKFKTSTATC